MDPLINVAAVDGGDIADQVGEGGERPVWGWEGRSCTPKWVYVQHETPKKRLQPKLGCGFGIQGRSKRETLVRVKSASNWDQEAE